MSERGVNLTLKADGGAPWLTINVEDPDVLKSCLSAIDGDLLQKAVETSLHFTKAYQVANGMSEMSPAQEEKPAQAQSPWGAPAAQQQPNQQTSGGFPANGTPHPAGSQCEKCGALMQAKTIWSKAKQKNFHTWSCPNQRSRDDGHTVDWV